MKLKKLNIMKTRSEISDDEIHSMMNFDKVLQQHKSSKRWTNGSMIAGSCIVVIMIIGGLFLFKPKEKDIPVPEVKQSLSPVAVPEKKEVGKEIEQKEAKSSKPLKTIRKPKQEPANEVTDVYTEAQPATGYDNLYSYFEKELKYPSGPTVAAEGDVSVTFVINRKGEPEQIRFINSLGPEFDKEVIRVINNMPAWKPATKNGKAVPAKISQTFTFNNR